MGLAKDSRDCLLGRVVAAGSEDKGLPHAAGAEKASVGQGPGKGAFTRWEVAPRTRLMETVGP